MTVVFWFLLFALSAAIILIAGRSLSRDADRIAEIYGLGRGFVGVLLLGAVTSLPELITTTSSASPLIGSGDIAVGNIFGSNLFNLLILVLLDPFAPRRELSKSNIVTGLVALGITTVAMVGMALHSSVNLGPLPLLSMTILATYLFGMRLIFVADRDLSETPPDTAERQQDVRAHRVVLLRFFAAAVGIIIAGLLASWAVDGIVDNTSIGASFAGALLLALATSLPELVVSLGAVRLGQVEMAMGNVLGSNCFNVAILAIADVADGPMSIFAKLSPGLLVVALLSAVMVCVALVGGIVGIRRRLPVLRLAWDTSTLAVLYFVGMAYLFFSS